MNISNPKDLSQLLVTELNIADLTPEMQIQIIGQVSNLLVQGLLVQATLHLEDEKLDELNVLMENGEKESEKDSSVEKGMEIFTNIMKFLEVNLPQFDVLLAEEMMNIKNLLK